MATVNNRYLTITRGAVVITGNTLGLDRRSFFLLPGNTGSQAAHLTPNDLSVASGWSAQGALDPTVGISTNNVISEIGSRAVLYIPPTATVLYAELVWFATIINNLDPDQDITFIAPDANGNEISHSITPDPTTANTVVMPGYEVYIRSADVTDKVIPGTQTYTALGIPARVDALISAVICSGWCLLVAYEEPSESFKNLSIYVLGLPVRTDAANVSITIPNVITPATEPINGRAVLAAAEGDINFTGAFVRFGATTQTQVDLSGPNNPANNFFRSAINVGDYNGTIPTGTVDTRGSMGNNNHNDANTVLGARQGTDVTNVDISAGLAPNQTSAILTFGTDSDNYVPVAFGTQIEVVPSIEKTVSPAIATLGDELLYTITVNNPGTALPWENVFLQDNLSAYTTFIPGSVTIDTVTYSDYDPETGFIIANTLNKTTVTITYRVTVTSVPPNYILNNIANVSFEIITPTGTISDTITSNPAYTNISLSTLTIDKTNSPDQTVACATILTYNITVTNTGNVDAIIPAGELIDPIPPDTTYIANSIMPDTLGLIYDSTNNRIINSSAITVSTLAPLNFSYQVSVNC